MIHSLIVFTISFLVLRLNADGQGFIALTIAMLAFVWGQKHTPISKKGE